MHSGLESPYGLGYVLPRPVAPASEDFSIVLYLLSEFFKGRNRFHTATCRRHPLVAIPPHEAILFCAWSSKARCGSGTSHNPQPRQHSPHVSSLGSSI